MDMRRALILFLLLTATLACSTNPVTGKREFNLVSEQQEIAMGQEGDVEVLQEYGLYNEKPQLNQLVDRLGRKLAAVSDRPNLPWHFAILDSPIVNAMALPGGYVYVTRGIMERMNSEDELAGVIAHEISHVAARHAARSMSQQQLAQLGMVVGSIAAGPAASQAYGSLVQLGAGLLFTRYSRQQESQADLLGTAYMTEAGFNPKGAENMLLALQRLEKGKGGGVERYFIDHPDPVKRVADVRHEISGLQQRNPAIGTQALDRGLVPRMDGVITGPSTLATTIRDNVVYNRRYGIIATPPRDWVVSTEPGALFVMSPPKSTGEGLVVQEVPIQKLQQFASAQAAVRSQLQQMGLQYVNSGTAQTSTGQQLAVDLWSGNTDRGQVAVESTQLVEQDSAIIFLQISQARSRGDGLMGILRELRFDRAAARAAQPPRIHVATSRSGDRWEELARRATGRTDDAEAIAKLNGYDYPSSVPVGVPIKLPQDVVREPKS